jgi:hypothetical protein
MAINITYRLGELRRVFFEFDVLILKFFILLIHQCYLKSRLKFKFTNGGFKFEVQQLMVAWCSTSPLRIILHAVIPPQALCVAGG